MCVLNFGNILAISVFITLEFGILWYKHTYSTELYHWFVAVAAAGIAKEEDGAATNAGNSVRISLCYTPAGGLRSLGASQGRVAAGAEFRHH